MIQVLSGIRCKKCTFPVTSVFKAPAIRLLPQVDFMFEAGAYVMKLVRGAYSCVTLVSGVGLVAFRDPWGVR